MKKLPLWKIKARRLQKTWNDLDITTPNFFPIKRRILLNFQTIGLNKYYHVNQELLHGFIIRRGSIQIDNSIGTQLFKLKKLMKGK